MSTCLKRVSQERFKPVTIQIDWPKNLEYITDGSGKKKAVIIPIEEFEKLMEDMEDLAAITDRSHEPVISHDELISRLRQDGLLE